MENMTDKFCVTMDSKEELALLVQMPNKIVMSKQFSNGLYDMDPDDENIFVLTRE